MSLKTTEKRAPRVDPDKLAVLMSKIDPPNGRMIRDFRDNFGLTQQEAASLVGLSHGSRWAEFEAGARPIDLARWELFQLKTNSHPYFSISIKELKMPSRDSAKSDAQPSAPPIQSEQTTSN